jgi:hypothetical protein
MTTHHSSTMTLLAHTKPTTKKMAAEGKGTEPSTACDSHHDASSDRLLISTDCKEVLILPDRLLPTATRRTKQQIADLIKNDRWTEMVHRFDHFVSTEFDLVPIEHLLVLSYYSKATRAGRVETARLLWELCHACSDTPLFVSQHFSQAMIDCPRVHHVHPWEKEGVQDSRGCGGGWSTEQSECGSSSLHVLAPLAHSGQAIETAQVGQ